MTMAAAISLPKSSSFYTLTTIILLSSLTCRSTAKNINDFHIDQLDHKPMKQKLSHFRLYWHDIQTGRTPTSIKVIDQVPNATFGFGLVQMIDNPLTLGPHLNSKTVGKAQGFYGFASQEEFGLLMTMNFVFTYGKYNGSTITILGRNAVFEHVREMPVVGGSGIFRFGRGYAQAQTYTFNPETKDATVEYNVYVMHY